MPRRNRDRFAFTPERIAKMAELMDQGLTSKQAAREMTALYKHYVSRHALIGRAYRMWGGWGPRAGDPLPEPPRPVPVVERVRPDPDFPNRCVTAGCRGTRQKNLTGLCAECTKDRLARQGRARTNMREVSLGPAIGSMV